MASRILQFLGWPVVLGIAAAAAILLFTNSAKWLPKSESADWRGPVSYADAVRRAAPSVVNIYSRRQVIQRPRHPILDDPILGQLINARTSRTREAIGLGSGVILSKSGHIITNLHVVRGADEISIQLQDGRTAVATMIGADKETDLAVLKVELDNLIPIETVDSMKAEVGQVVLAIGNPYGVGQTVSQGIISAIGQKEFGNNNSRRPVYRESIQTDAAINTGNSGGALVDAHGRLLGINSATLDRAASYGISFAIPTNNALKVLKDIREYGHVRRGYIGISDISAQPLNERQLGLLGFEYQTGLMVTAVMDGGPASAAFQEGDIIIGINGQRRTDRSYVYQLLFDLAPGETLTFEVVRGGREIMLNITATTAPSIQN